MWWKPAKHEIIDTVGKVRAFGEYVNETGHRCSCYEGRNAPYPDAPGPPQYELQDVYFCFSQFQNPFTRDWVARYVAMTIFSPNLDALHVAERYEGRALIPSEWPLIKGVLIEGLKPIKTTAKGLALMMQKVDIRLKAEMIDEIDHRIIKAVTASEWRREQTELCARYKEPGWATMGTTGKNWMRLHCTTNTLEMLRQMDIKYIGIPVSYDEPPSQDAQGEEKTKAGRAASDELAKLESVETTAVQEELIEPPTRKDWSD